MAFANVTVPSGTNVRKVICTPWSGYWDGTIMVSVSSSADILFEHLYMIEPDDRAAYNEFNGKAFYRRVSPSLVDELAGRRHWTLPANNRYTVRMGFAERLVNTLYTATADVSFLFQSSQSEKTVDMRSLVPGGNPYSVAGDTDGYALPNNNGRYFYTDTATPPDTHPPLV